NVGFEIYYLMSIMFFWSVDFMNFAYFLLDKLLDILIAEHEKKELYALVAEANKKVLELIYQHDLYLDKRKLFLHIYY
ncbi:hypothetical protein, partial [Mycoplasmopsis bovis]|uniref:hypothetical protein n=1 Tax=Mycoplasmopsis bovis TaxID=28903 RepID=UPI003D2CE183